MIKALSRILKQDRERMNIPRSVQQVIPVKRIWLDGIWLVGNKYSKCWRFTDINYAIASKDDKTSMFLDYSELLNALDSNATTKITVCNKRMNRLRDDAENAQADLMAYVASIEMETDDDDSDDGDEEKEPKEPSVKEVETYLKSLGTDEAKASLKQIAALKKEKNRLNREVKKKESELQEKIDAIREELTEEQCEDLVMRLLHDGFVEELDAYLFAEVQKTIRAVNKLWEKYHVSVTTLLDERKAAEDKLNGFLAQLGYIPKKEVDA